MFLIFFYFERLNVLKVIVNVVIKGIVLSFGNFMLLPLRKYINV